MFFSSFVDEISKLAYKGVPSGALQTLDPALDPKGVKKMRKDLQSAGVEMAPRPSRIKRLASSFVSGLKSRGKPAVEKAKPAARVPTREISRILRPSQFADIPSLAE